MQEYSLYVEGNYLDAVISKCQNIFNIWLTKGKYACNENKSKP